MVLLLLKQSQINFSSLNLNPSRTKAILRTGLILHTSECCCEGFTHDSIKGVVSPLNMGDFTSIVHGSEFTSVPFCRLGLSGSENWTFFRVDFGLGEGSSVTREVCAPVGLCVGVGRVSWQVITRLVLRYVVVVGAL